MSYSTYSIRKAGFALVCNCLLVAGSLLLSVTFFLACTSAQTLLVPKNKDLETEQRDVHIEPLAGVAVSRTISIPVTLDSSSGAVTLSLRATGGNGEARFADGSTSMAVSRNTTVQVKGVTEGHLRLEATRGRELLAARNFIVFNLSALEVSMPSTKNAASGVAPPPETFTTSNSSLDFATSDTQDLMAVFQATSVGTPTVKAVGVAADVANQLRWQIDRDPTDTVATGTPALSAQTGGEVVVTPNTAGNFRLVCYVDANSNRALDSGEELKVLLMAVVRVTVQPDHFISTNGTFSGSNRGVSTQDAMRIQIEVLLEGGGADRRIGVDRVVLGNVGNLLVDDFTVHYPASGAQGNEAGTGREMPGAPVPMLDSSRVRPRNEPTGGTSPFRSRSSDIVVDSGVPKGTSKSGQIRRVSGNDAPGFGWDTRHPSTGNAWTTTDGGNAFREFIVGFSKTFPKYYVAIATGDWTVTATGRSEGGTWKSDNATVKLGTAAENKVPLKILVDAGTPQPGDTSGLQILGLSFVNEFTMEYAPKGAKQ